jgi:hypothetical protein
MSGNDYVEIDILPTRNPIHSADSLSSGNIEYFIFDSEIKSPSTGDLRNIKHDKNCYKKPGFQW